MFSRLSALNIHLNRSSVTCNLYIDFIGTAVQLVATPPAHILFFLFWATYPSEIPTTFNLQSFTGKVQKQWVSSSPAMPQSCYLNFL